MTRKMNFFIRKLQFQRTIPGSLENLNCLTLSNSKISEGVGFCTQENGKSWTCRSKVCFSTLEKTLYISSTFPKLVLFCNSGSLLCFPPSILLILCFLSPQRHVEKVVYFSLHTLSGGLQFGFKHGGEVFLPVYIEFTGVD